MEKLGTNKLNMQKLLAPAALVILYIVFSIFGNNFLSLELFSPMFCYEPDSNSEKQIVYS